LPHRNPTAPLTCRSRAAPLAFDAFFQHWHQPFLHYATVQLRHIPTAQVAVLEAALLIQQDWTRILAQSAPAATAFTVLDDTINAIAPPRHQPPSPRGITYQLTRK
jgi:hypothetical protein